MSLKDLFQLRRIPSEFVLDILLDILLGFWRGCAYPLH